MTGATTSHGGSERLLIISSRVAADYQLTESGIKNLQHMFTSWFPRAVYYDLTSDTVRVDVIVRRGNLSKKNVFHTSFLKADDSVIKTMAYDEERIVGKKCEPYDPSRTRYEGKKDGVDYRHVFYRTVGRSAG